MLLGAVWLTNRYQPGMLARLKEPPEEEKRNGWI